MSTLQGERFFVGFLGSSCVLVPVESCVGDHSEAHLVRRAMYHNPWLRLSTGCCHRTLFRVLQFNITSGQGRPHPVGQQIPNGGWHDCEREVRHDNTLGVQSARAPCLTIVLVCFCLVFVASPLKPAPRDLGLSQINSGVIKLSVLTPVVTGFRGLSGESWFMHVYTSTHNRFVCVSVCVLQ